MESVLAPSSWTVSGRLNSTQHMHITESVTIPKPLVRIRQMHLKNKITPVTWCLFVLVPPCIIYVDAKKRGGGEHKLLVNLARDHISCHSYTQICLSNIACRLFGMYKMLNVPASAFYYNQFPHSPSCQFNHIYDPVILPALWVPSIHKPTAHTRGHYHDSGATSRAQNRPWTLHFDGACCSGLSTNKLPSTSLPMQPSSLPSQILQHNTGRSRFLTSEYYNFCEVSLNRRS